MNDPIPAPSTLVTSLPRELDAVVLKGISRDPDQRFATAEEMARALEAVVPPARPAEVGKWIGAVAGSVLAERAKRIAEIESQSSDVSLVPTATAPPTHAAHAPTEATQGTDLSAAAPPMTGGGRGPWRVVGALVAAATIGAAIVMVRGVGNGPPDASSSAVAARPSPPTASPSAASVAPSAGDPAPPVAPSAPPTNASAAPATPVTAPATAVAPPATTAAPPATRRPVAPRSPTPAAPKPDCNPPYTFDENGVKHFKRGCL